MPKLNDFGDAGMFKDEALTGGGDISTAMANVLTRLNTSLEGRFEDVNWPMELETSEGEFSIFHLTLSNSKPDE